MKVSKTSGLVWPGHSASYFSVCAVRQTSCYTQQVLHTIERTRHASQCATLWHQSPTAVAVPTRRILACRVSRSRGCLLALERLRRYLGSDVQRVWVVHVLVDDTQEYLELTGRPWSRETSINLPHIILQGRDSSNIRDLPGTSRLKMRSGLSAVDASASAYY